MHSVAHFETDNAQRYLDAMCQHFGRKVEVQHSDQKGRVCFAFGRCDMTANPFGLDLVAMAEDAAGLKLVADVVTRHLERYAFRENPRLDWQLQDLADRSKSEKL